MADVSAETIVQIADPSSLMAMFVQHITDDHDLAFETSESGVRYIEQKGFGLAFKADQKGLHVRIRASTSGVLMFFKEEVAHHVAEVDQAAADTIRWSGETARVGALPETFKLLQVKSSKVIFSGMQRVTLIHEDVTSLMKGGIHLRLMMPLDPKRAPVWPRMAANGAPIWPAGEDKLHSRYFTLRHCRPEEGEIDIDVVHHGCGLISNWAAAAEAGQTIGAMGPAGGAALPSSKVIFLAADGTGLPAVARLMERVDADASGHVVIAMPKAGDAESYLPPSSLNVHKLLPDHFESEILGLAERLTKPGEINYAFFAGEFQNAQDLRAHFKKKLGLDKTTQISAAYWRRGVSGFAG